MELVLRGICPCGSLGGRGVPYWLPGGEKGVKKIVTTIKALFVCVEA